MAVGVDLSNDLDELPEHLLVVADDDSGNFKVVRVPTEKPFAALREAMPYLEEHVEKTNKLSIMIYPIKNEPWPGPGEDDLDTDI